MVWETSNPGSWERDFFNPDVWGSLEADSGDEALAQVVYVGGDPRKPLQEMEK